MTRLAMPTQTLLLASILLAATGCFDAWRQQQKAPTSALWVGQNSEPLAASALAQLKEAGIAELFLEAAELDLGGPGLKRLTLPSVPSPLAATLVIAGAWSGVGDPEAAAKALGPALADLSFAVESQGIVPAGFHFDFKTIDSLASCAQFFTALRPAVERSLFLSVSLPRGFDRDPDAPELIGAVDFVVPFVYGQRVQEGEDPTAWDFVALQHALEKLEESGKPYLVGIVGLGTATHLNAKGTVRARTTRLSLQEIVWNRQVKLRSGFSLQGVNRRVYEVAADRAARVGDFELQAGDSIRVVRTSTSDLEELRRLLGAWDLKHRLGELYFRLPAENEGLSLKLENLTNALDATPAEPLLELVATVQRRTGRGWIFRFGIINQSAEISELSLIDNNFLQVTTQSGSFDDRVDLGDFFRYDLGHRQADGGLERNIRKPTTIRLHAPIIEGFQRITSGDVELYHDGEPELELEVSFLLPDGRTFRFGPFPWRDGMLRVPPPPTE